MPKLIISQQEEVDPRHHNGGFMMRGGLDLIIVELSPVDYARKIVSSASLDVAYRKWDVVNGEVLYQTNGYYLACDTSGKITFSRVGSNKIIRVSDNDFWRHEARKFVRETCEQEIEKLDGAHVDEIGEAKRLAGFGVVL